jgi:hypothetical protein
MTDQYLRIDGVNHAAVMEDTTQLSVVRGGSFLLRAAVKYVAETYHQALKALSIEASTGLFQVLSGDAKGLRDQIADALSEHEQFRHFTFVVDVQSDKVDLAKALASVTARNRFRQMRQLSVALPPWNDRGFSPCEWDNLRPGDSFVDVKRDGGNEPAVSQSVKVRHNHGRTKKQAFYRDETKGNGVVDPAIAGLNYTRELDEIATGSRFPDLENKLAVIYLDGNKFGSIPGERARQIHGTTGSAQIQTFDVELRRYQSAFLRRFLLTIDKDVDFHARDGRLRIETLLWGGDELILVLPAWKGFWALNWFYEHSSEWNYHGIPLTHAGGLVFCHYKTPVFRVRNLARELADAVKGRLDGKRQNQFEYFVLESIDFPTEPLKRFWARRYGALAENRRPLPPITAWDAERGKLQALLKDKKGQVHALVAKAIVDPERGFAEQRSRFAEVLGPSTFEPLQATVKQLFPSEASAAWPWIHLLELWDYLMLEEPVEVSSGS